MATRHNNSQTSRLDDTLNIRIPVNGQYTVNLGAGSDDVLVSGRDTQVRLTFTSSEVGNGSATDSNTQTNQDGGLAVRFQAETVSGALTNLVNRFDDEGINFVGYNGITFDVRDLVSGAQRGNQFHEVQLGTSGRDKLFAVDTHKSIYINAGLGNDVLTGGRAADFLVGGGGNDDMLGGRGNDSFIGGGGNDLLNGGSGRDSFIFAAALDASTNVDTITSFSHDIDTLRLDDAFFAGLALGELDSGAFARTSQAAQDDDRIIYNTSNGRLFFDATGGDRGDAVLFAILKNDPNNLDSGDFLII